MAKKVNKIGRMNMSEMKNLINKKVGMNLAHDLRDENPTEVKEWIPTGSRWLDSVICRGKLAGIPVGKIVEIAGLESTGKSKEILMLFILIQSLLLILLSWKVQAAILIVYCMCKLNLLSLSWRQ